MRVVFTIGAPKDVHMFHRVAKLLKRHDHEIIFVAKEYSCNLDLLNAYQLPYIIVGKSYGSFFGKACEIVMNDVRGALILKKLGADVVVGDALLGHPAKVLGKSSIAFVDGDPPRLYPFLYRYVYWSDTFCTPSNFRINLGYRHIRYHGYHELAYLHPKYFKPDPCVYDLLELTSGEKYIVFRFSAFDAASHDVGLRGLTLHEKITMIQKLREYAHIFVSSEKPLEPVLSEYALKIPPHRIHDVLAYASLVVAETAMVSEAAVLGTPAILLSPKYSSGAALSYSNFEDFRRFGLLYIPKDKSEAINKAIEILEGNSKREYNTRRRNLLENTIDVTAFAAWFVEDYPESFRIMRINPGYEDRFKSLLT